MERIVGLPVALQQEAFSIFGSKGWSRSNSFLCKVERIGSKIFWMIVTGPGAERARAGANFLLECGSCVMINLGVAGALVEDLEAGHVVSPSVIKGESRVVQAEPGLKQRLDGLLLSAGVRVRPGVLFTASQVMETTESKMALQARTNAHLVDMEAVYLGEICRDADIPFLAVKAISDRLDQSLPPVVGRCVKKDGGLNIAMLAFALTMRPWLIPRLLNVKESFQKAIYSLELARSAIVSNLDV